MEGAEKSGDAIGGVDGGDVARTFEDFDPRAGDQRGGFLHDIGRGGKVFRAADEEGGAADRLALFAVVGFCQCMAGADVGTWQMPWCSGYAGAVS